MVPAQTTNARLRWFICGLLFLVTTINYIDRSALGLVEPILKHMLGGDANPARYNQQYNSIVTCFIVAYGLGFLVSGRVIDRIGAKKGLALTIVVWSLASISHAFARTPSVLAWRDLRSAWENRETSPPPSRPPPIGSPSRRERWP